MFRVPGTIILPADQAYLLSTAHRSLRATSGDYQQERHSHYPYV
jgi:hypothetical protein